MDHGGGHLETLLRIGDEFRLDHGAELLVARESVEGVLRQAKTPVPFVVLEDPRHAVRAFLVDVQVRLEFVEREHLVDGK
jgi:hypothetical protein